MPGCSLVSFHFLLAILCPQAVMSQKSAPPIVAAGLLVPDLCTLSIHISLLLNDTTANINSPLFSLLRRGGEQGKGARQGKTGQEGNQAWYKKSKYIPRFLWKCSLKRAPSRPIKEPKFPPKIRNWWCDLAHGNCSKRWPVCCNFLATVLTPCPTYLCSLSILLERY